MIHHFSRICAGVMIALLGMSLLRTSLADEPPAPAEKGDSEDVPRVSLEVARDRARLLQDAYVSTLAVMHRKYFHGDLAVVPARALEDVFDELKQQSHIEANWIAVSLKAMSVENEPETQFEKHAARELDAGQSEVEAIDAGYYRRAVPIRLTGGCLRCHAGLFQQGSPSKKFAGLVVSVPVKPGETLDSADESADAN